jgi:glycosyltransferase 2 family protein
MKQVKSVVKPMLRWVILGGALFFLGSILRQHWQSVVGIRVDGRGWTILAIALGVTLLAHICAGWVWQYLLRKQFRQPVSGTALIQAYLKTTIAKYLPGNVWHYYGRVTAAKNAGASLPAATVSVLLEPLLMAAAALVITLGCSQQLVATYGLPVLLLQGLSFGLTLGVIHPRVLNPIIRRLAQAKQPGNNPAAPIFQIDQYPLVPLVGELGFLGLRGLGFLCTFSALGGFNGFSPSQVPLLLGVFSFAWLLGLVVPGAPGGVGVFEATAIALLSSTFAPGILLSVVAVYRLVSVLAEAIGAGLATADEHFWR